MPTVFASAPCGKLPACDSFYDCFYGLNLPEGSKIQRVSNGCLSDNRNKIVELAKGYDYLFLVDDDLMFSPDVVLELLKHDKDVVSGIACQREPPFRPYIWNSISANGELGYANLEGNSLVKTLATGAGGVLIKMSVFDKLKKPYFEMYYEGEKLWWDDIVFAKKLIEADVEVFVDPKLTFWHATKACVAPIFFNNEWHTCVRIGEANIMLPMVK